METRQEILLPFCHLFWLLTSDRYSLHTNSYNYATTNLTRKFGIPVERAGIDQGYLRHHDDDYDT